MTAPGRGDARSGAAAFRGAVLIAIAVVVGAVMLGSAFDRGSGTSGNGDAGNGEETTTTGGDATTSTTPPVTHPLNQVLVYVLNGGGGQGVASTAANTLAALGYVTVEPSNAPQNVAQSTIYYAPDYEGDAPGVASALGLTAAQILPLPTPPPFDVRGANVTVILGPEVQPG